MNQAQPYSFFFRALYSKTVLILSFLVFFAVCTGLSAQSFAASNPKYASVVMDADTGLILHERYANKQLHPASLTKIMTLMLTFEALEQGKLKLHERIPVSRRAAGMIPSKLDLKAGSSIRVNDAIYSLVTKSANDVAVALAERVGGSESNFARMMTRKARSIGMSRTTFRNASGLHHPGQISTARDMAILARTVINNYPEYYRYFSRKSFTYAGKTYRNHNRLMNTYKGMDGMKTGYIHASGFNLVASAVRNNRRIIGVVFGGRTSKTRNAHMASLLDRGFAKINAIRVASAKVPLPPRKPGILVALNSLNKVKPAAGGIAKPETQKWALLNTALETGMFKNLIGEGDYDPAVSRRLETGLMAIAAHRGGRDSYKKSALKPVSRPESWAIQVGAFKSRAATDNALRAAVKKLPSQYATQSNPMIAPLKTTDGWLFRGRLSGYTKTDAFKACKYLHDCMPIAPQSY